MHQAAANLSKLQLFKAQQLRDRELQQKTKADLLDTLDQEHKRDRGEYGDEENLLEQTLERTLT